ncbi:MAG TPA: YkgJ family cysteine cluster protein [Bryobacteraceae bacterium]|nr:YkgJ family cysteine cluster protein [Bryobacteraceae bacterium]
MDRLASSLEEARRRSGEWLVCRLGCTQCCVGSFGITALDAQRLARGMAALEAKDPVRAAAVRRRAAEYVATIAPFYPGDTATGELWDEDRLPLSMDETPCPALDPASGACDLYDARPVTCRAFGPATRLGEETFGACELCYNGATDEQMAACALDLDPEGLEKQILEELEAGGAGGMTIVAYALITGVGRAPSPRAPRSGF